MNRLLVIGLGLAALVGLFLFLRPGSDPEPPATSSPTPTVMSTGSPEPTSTGDDVEPSSTTSLDAVEFEVEEGRVEGPGQITVVTGERVSFEVESDIADSVHIHGYDILRGLPADRKVAISFEATIPGVFEVELEDAGVLLTRLAVTA